MHSRASFQVAFHRSNGGWREGSSVSRRAVRLKRVQRAQFESQLHQPVKRHGGCHLQEAQLRGADQQIAKRAHEGSVGQCGGAHVARSAAHGMRGASAGHEHVHGIGCESEYVRSQRLDVARARPACEGVARSRAAECEHLCVCDVEAIHREPGGNGFDLGRSGRSMPTGDRRPAERDIETSRKPAFGCGGM